MIRRLLLSVAMAGFAPACLVVTTNPAYDGKTIVWDPELVGSWVDADDNASMQIDRAEWSSYRIRYEHPIEKGELTGYLTALGGDRYLDVMPARGTDRGSFLIPVHAVLRVRLAGDRLELTPLSFDWFFERLHRGRPVPGLQSAFDQHGNALIVSPTADVRAWLSANRHNERVFGAPAVFTRSSKGTASLR